MYRHAVQSVMVEEVNLAVGLVAAMTLLPFVYINCKLTSVQWLEVIYCILFDWGKVTTVCFTFDIILGKCFTIFNASEYQVQKPQLLCFQIVSR